MVSGETEMGKTLLYKLFGIGKIPEKFLAEIKSEGIILKDEGFKGTLTYKNFRAPGRYSNWKRQWFTGAVVLTEARLSVWQYARMILDVRWSDERIRKVHPSIEADGVLLISYDAGLLQPDAQGLLECRLWTTQANNVPAEIERRQMQKR